MAKAIPFQFRERRVRLANWCAFWLIAKDVLRLSEISSYSESRAIVEKDELPIDSMVKLMLFNGKRTRTACKLARPLGSPMDQK